MRVRRSIEFSAWIVGVTLLGVYATARVSFERGRVAGIEAFREAPALNAVPRAASTDAESGALLSMQIDQSLWSPQRVSAFAANPGIPQGVLSIPALELEVPIYSGATEFNLNRGAAHIEGTAALSQPGNVGIAAHRDGFFRKLKDIAIDDEIGLDAGGQTLHYRVVDISVVSPSAIHVLAPTATPSITLVTCYPFYFVGTAPQRYIVRAELADAPPAGTERSSETLQTEITINSNEEDKRKQT
jgi:sortase A